MKPEQFIRECGLKKAKALCEGAPENANVYDIDNNEYADTREDTFGLSCNLIGLRRLSHLVGSLELIKAYGGIESCKQSLYMLHELTEDPKPIREAIRDHESIYGGGDE